MEMPEKICRKISLPFAEVLIVRFGVCKAGY